MTSPSSAAVTTPFRTGHAGDACHWYEGGTGKPVYEITGANGKERAPTLRDARPNGWLPGVTSILNVAAKPQLERWKVEQALLSCLTSPMLDGYRAGKVAEKDFLQHVYECAEEQALKARDLGTEIHTAIEMYFLGESVEGRWYETARMAHALVQQICPSDRWQAECSFGCSRHGYGGKIDLHLPAGIHPNGRAIYLDWKGRDFDEPQTEAERKALLRKCQWPEQAMQLAAYCCGHADTLAPDALLINGFFSRTRPGVVVIADPWDQHDALKAWHQFRGLLMYWRHERGYFPA